MTGMGTVATEIEPSTARLLLQVTPPPETAMALPVSGSLKIGNLSPTVSAGPRLVTVSVPEPELDRVPVTTASLLLGERDLLRAMVTLPARERLLLIVNVPTEGAVGPGASVAPELIVTAPLIKPFPPSMPPEMSTEPVPVPLLLVLLMNNVPALLVVLPE